MIRISAETEIAFTPQSITIEGRAWFPVMGEMHYSRYPAAYWEEELNKMKAGGVDIVSLYVIWIHHEEEEGCFDFTKDRDLHRFLETVKESGLSCILRIGPWAHGEVRNGGFPDWLLNRSKEEHFTLRANDPKYLQFVRRFYEKTYEQCKGLLHKDAGPVIGVQIENEYGHVGGQTGSEGEQHMCTLHDMAYAIGFDVPLYTATGWGGAVTGGMLPVMGGYCEAPWDQRLTEIEPSGNYIFTRERNDHNIGSDHGIGEGITFDMSAFPYLTAELGGGLQVTHHRRPIATGRDIGAMSMVKLGSGVSLLGYYMYHGGTNPKGKFTTLQESRETGYPNDLPVLSYDFNAPIREYGQITDTFREIRLFAMFVHDFGEDLCKMPYVEQPANPKNPSNLTDIRTAARYIVERDAEGKRAARGYFFVNNYQRHYQMAAHQGVTLNVYDEKGQIVETYPDQKNIADGVFFFYPFNLPIGAGILQTAQATPLCIIHGAGMNGADAYVFYKEAEEKAHYITKGDLSGNIFITLSREEALHASKVVCGDKEHLMLSAGDIVSCKGNRIDLFCLPSDAEKPTFRIWPDADINPDRFQKKAAAKNAKGELESSDFAVYEAVEKICSSARVYCVEMQKEQDGTAYYEMTVDHIPEEAQEVFLQINYVGDRAEMFLGSEMVADNYYTGQKWEIGLKRFIEQDGVRKTDHLTLQVLLKPLCEKDQIYLEKWPSMNDGCACQIEEINIVPQYRTIVF